MSSVRFFAASIGREIGAIRNYTYDAYEVPNYREYANYGSPSPRAVVKILADGSSAEIREVSQYLLGYDMVGGGRDAKAIYQDLVAALRRPLHSFAQPQIPYVVRESLARLTGKPGFVNMGVRSIARKLRAESLSILSIDEFDVWLNGQRATNCCLREQSTPGRGGIHGTAVIGYSW